MLMTPCYTGESALVPACAIHVYCPAVHCIGTPGSPFDGSLPFAPLDHYPRFPCLLHPCITACSCIAARYTNVSLICSPKSLLIAPLLHCSLHPWITTPCITATLPPMFYYNRVQRTTWPRRCSRSRGTMRLVMSGASG